MKVKLGLLLLALVLGIYFVRVDYTPAPFSDENLYFYMAKEVSEGSVPYRDFFFAHPPLLILPQALLFLLFGPGFLLGRMVPVMSGAAILVLSYFIGDELKKGSGIFASAIVLSSYSFGLMGGRGMGVALSLALVLGSVYCSLRKRDGAAGVLLALSMFVRLSNFPVFLVLAGYHIWKKRWGFVKGLAILGVFGLLALIPNFTKDVFIYHLMKSAVADRGGALAFVSREWILLALVPLGIFVKWDERKLLILGCMASGILVLALSQVRIFYLGFVIPFAALVAGAGIVTALEKWERLKPLLVLVFVGVLMVNAYAYSFEATGIDPALERVFTDIGGPVFDTSSSLGAYYAVAYGGRISGKVVDMYPVRAASGAIMWADVLAKLESDPPRFIFDNRGEFVGYNEREVWLNTPLKEFVYENYIPWRFVSITSNQEIVIMWERKEFGQGVELAGNENRYYVKYYTGRFGESEIALTERETIHQGSAEDLGPSKEFVDFLESHVVVPGVVVIGAWDVPEVGNGYHWLVEEKSLIGGPSSWVVSSETWVREYQGDFVLFTESRDHEKTVAFVIQMYRPEKGIIFREIYQNLAGGFVKVYEEEII